MAKPNYSFEKRQRELAKKKKKEEKLAEKNARKSGSGQAGPDSLPPDDDAANDAVGAPPVEGGTQP